MLRAPECAPVEAPTVSEPSQNPSGATASERLSPRVYALAIAVAMGLALLLRLPALGSDLWIDEVWSWGIAQSLKSWREVFTLESSNNHPLNTLWFYVVGDTNSAWIYRSVSLVAGVASVALVAAVVRPFGRVAGLWAAAIVAVAYLPTVYASEARGYALEVALSLVAFLAVRRWNERPGAGPLVLGWAAIALGFLSQYLFVHVYLAIGLWSLGRIVQAGPGRSRELGRALVLHSFPLVFFAALYFGVLRHVFNAGAPPWQLGEVLQQTFGWALGWPEHPVALALGIAVVLGVLVLDALALARSGRDEWIFHLAVIVIAPVATSILLKDQYLCPRYFLVSLVFWLLGLARVLARTKPAIAAVVFVVFAAGNLVYTQAFLRGGRGGYRAAVERMGAESASSTITVTGNYDFNVSALLIYYQRFLPPGKKLEFHSRAALPKDGVEWIVVDEPRFASPPSARLHAPPMTFALRASWTHFGPCGADWAIYKRE
jgi:hypothetical protein